MKILNLTLIVFLIINVSFAQDFKKQNSKAPSILEEMLLKSKFPSTPTVQIPLEDAIDPTNYTIGPGDEITIGIWGTFDFSYPLVVSPEGSLIIPTVGEISVSGKTLEKIKKEISTAVKKKYSNSEVTATLTNPRTFLIQISGNILNQSTYIVNPITRVDKAVLFANQTNLTGTTNTLLVNTTKNEKGDKLDLDLEKLDPNKVSEIYKKISTRNIILKRKDGTEQRIDIPYFYQTGDDRFNPFLKEGDRIIVPSKNLDNDFVSIYGALHQTGNYEYAPDDNLERLITLAGGFTNLANKDQIYIYRTMPNSDIKEIQKIETKNWKEVKLNRGDQIVVKDIEIKPKNYFIQITGEVVNPGNLPINSNITTLKEAIEQSGGFTENADLFSAKIIRAGDDLSFIDKRFDLTQNLRSMHAKALDSLYIFSEIELKKKMVNVDFVKLFIEKDTNYNITLNFGDIIIVPRISNTVYVFGQVYNPGYLDYNKNLDCDDFIKMAGGVTDNSDDSEIRIIKAKTYQWLDPDETNLQPGDAIFVPRKIEKDFRFYFNYVRDGLSVLASLITVYLLLNK